MIIGKVSLMTIERSIFQCIYIYTYYIFCFAWRNFVVPGLRNTGNNAYVDKMLVGPSSAPTPMKFVVVVRFIASYVLKVTT